MRNRINLWIIVFLILGVTSKKSCADVMLWNGLPDLVIKSDIIASGTISIKYGKTILLTNHVLKGKAPKELAIVVGDNQYKAGAANLIENEDVLLFLKSLDANSAQ